jgi:hypothetical protein
MTCQEARDLFSARQDGELSPSDAAQLEAHLSGCAECRAEWARFDQVVSLLHATVPPHAPPGFVDRVVGAAQREPWYRRVIGQVLFPLRVKVPLEAAALVLIGGLAVLTFQRSPEMQQMARQDYRPIEAPRPEPIAKEKDTPTAATDNRLADRARPQSSDMAAEAPVPTPPVAAAPPAPQTTAPSIAAAPPPTPPTPSVAPPAADRQAGGLAQQQLKRDVEERKETAAKSAAAPPQSPAAPLRARAFAAQPDVSARLTARDPSAALTALGEILRRHAGTEISRRPDAGAQIVELLLPRSALDAFVRELSQLGDFTSETRGRELPDSVRVSVRVSD